MEARPCPSPRTAPRERAGSLPALEGGSLPTLEGWGSPVNEAEANPRSTRLAVFRGREAAAPFSASVDVVVVGSGAGGAVAARELARDGRSVIVLEEGGHYTPEEYGAMTPTNTFRRLSRESGMSLVLGRGDTPLISLLTGKCVGGSSVLTGGVCFRIPEEVLHVWSHDLGLEQMTPERLEPFFS